MKILLFLIPFIFGLVEAKDITQFAIDNTSIDERVKGACQNMCGNRGWSRFESLHVSHHRGNLYKAVAKGSAKFHNVFEFAAGFEVEYLVEVTVYGTLNAKSCILTIDKIDISGDRFGVADAAKTKEGSRYRVRDCKKYT